MIKRSEDAMKVVRKAPPQTQDAIARLMFDMVAIDEPELIDPEHLVAVLEGERQAERGEFARAAEVVDAFRRFGTRGSV